MTYEALSNWVIPMLLATLVAVLGWMAINLNDIAKSLAVIVTRVDNHENRIRELEDLAPRRAAH